MIVCGIDENGLGPILGPLVATACAIQTPDPAYSAEALWRLSTPHLPVRDSKALFRPGAMARAEAAVLPWIQAAVGEVPSEADLHAKMVLNHPVYLEEREASSGRPVSSPCPPRARDCCFPDIAPLPCWGAGKDTGERTRDSQKLLAHGGFEIVAMQSVVLCPGRFNERVANGGKLFLDFSLFLDLATAVRKALHEDPLFLCGKVGSTARYGPWFSTLGFRAERIQESREESRYRVEGLGGIRFIRDADASHFPVALASMAGKYLRELAMERMNRTLRRWCPDIAPWVSGYPNRPTQDAIDRTAAPRAASGIPETCFLRSR